MSRWTDKEMRETLDASAEKSRQIKALTARVEELDLLLRNVYPVIDDGIYPLVKQAVRAAITKGERHD